MGATIWHGLSVDNTDSTPARVCNFMKAAQPVSELGDLGFKLRTRFPHL